MKPKLISRLVQTLILAVLPKDEPAGVSWLQENGYSVVNFDHGEDATRIWGQKVIKEDTLPAPEFIQGK